MPIHNQFNADKISDEALKVDRVYRAISDIKRRVMLDLIKSNPGITLSEVCDFFPISRFAVMKHLNVLEEALLIRHEREGKHKHLFIQQDQLVHAYDAWLKGMIHP